jgi:hypothetical protein
MWMSVGIVYVERMGRFEDGYSEMGWIAGQIEQSCVETVFRRFWCFGVDGSTIGRGRVFVLSIQRRCESSMAAT